MKVSDIKVGQRVRTIGKDEAQKRGYHHEVMDIWGEEGTVLEVIGKNASSGYAVLDLKGITRTFKTSSIESVSDSVEDWIKRNR